MYKISYYYYLLFWACHSIAFHAGLSVASPRGGFVPQRAPAGFALLSLTQQSVFYVTIVMNI